jgi:hypothetical protein
MVERSLSMREVRGSIPCISIRFFLPFFKPGTDPMDTACKPEFSRKTARPGGYFICIEKNKLEGTVKEL